MPDIPAQGSLCNPTGPHPRPRGTPVMGRQVTDRSIIKGKAAAWVAWSSPEGAERARDSVGAAWGRTPPAAWAPSRVADRMDKARELACWPGRIDHWRLWPLGIRRMR